MDFYRKNLVPPLKFVKLIQTKCEQVETKYPINLRSEAMSKVKFLVTKILKFCVGPHCSQLLFELAI